MVELGRIDIHVNVAFLSAFLAARQGHMNLLYLGRAMWVYTCTHGTHLRSLRKPRGDPAGNPTKHPERTLRPSGPQGPSIRHRVLLSQLCTTSENTGEAILMLVPVMPLPRPPPERANVCTYVPWGKSYGITCTGDSCNAEVDFNTIMYYVLWHQPSEKTNAHSLRDRQTPSSTISTEQ
jgi:hypothetical protein